MTQEQIERMTAEFDTPLYLFDLDVLREDIAAMKEVLQDHVSLCFAMKANPFLAKEMAGHVERIEVCSPGELRICMAQNIPMSKVVLSGVLKEERDIEELLCGGELPLFTAESGEQAELLRRLAKKHGRNISVLLRLTSGNQFGMDEAVLLDEAEALLDCPFTEFAGIHFFSGTQKRKSEQIRKELEMLDGLCARVKERTGKAVSHLEYGPGFGVEYFKGTKPWGCREALGALSDACECAKALTFGGTVTFEMGRFLTAMCGSFVTRVREVKENGGVRYCLVDGGMHHINYDGQVMAMKTPHCTQFPARMDEEEADYCICGALCTANDILIRKYPLRGIGPGDLLVFERTGAYSMTEGMSLFLSRNLPAVVCYSKDGGYEALRKQTPSYPLNMRMPENKANAGKT
ncbi:MAG: alanine racemase [Roseburia sp.]|nr:alanine racemase [Roseburia sp.]